MKKQTYQINYSTRGSYCAEVEASSPDEAYEIFTSAEYRSKNELWDLDTFSIVDEEGNEVHEGFCY